MNYNDLIRLTTGAIIPKRQDEGGTLPFHRGYDPRTPNYLRRNVNLPSQFIPGFSHKKGRKRKKRYQEYARDMERDVHDIYVDNHRGKRAKIMQSKEFQLQKERVEEFLANVSNAPKRRRQEERKISFKPDVSPPQEEKTAAAPEAMPMEAEEYEAPLEVQVKEDPSTPPPGTPRLMDEPLSPSAYSPSPEISRMYPDPPSLPDAPTTPLRGEALDRPPQLQSRPSGRAEQIEALSPKKLELDPPEIRAADVVESQADVIESEPVYDPRSKSDEKEGPSSLQAAEVVGAPAEFEERERDFKQISKDKTTEELKEKRARYQHDEGRKKRDELLEKRRKQIQAAEVVDAPIPKPAIVLEDEEPFAVPKEKKREFKDKEELRAKLRHKQRRGIASAKVVEGKKLRAALIEKRRKETSSKITAAQSAADDRKRRDDEERQRQAVAQSAAERKRRDDEERQRQAVAAERKRRDDEEKKKQKQRETAAQIGAQQKAEKDSILAQRRQLEARAREIQQREATTRSREAVKLAKKRTSQERLIFKEGKARVKVATKKKIKEKPLLSQRKHVSEMISKGIRAVNRKAEQLGLRKRSIAKRRTATRTKLHGEPITQAPSLPPRKPPSNVPEGIIFKAPPKRKPQPKLQPRRQATSYPVPKQPTLQPRRQAKSYPVAKDPALFPLPTTPPKKKPRPRAPRPIQPRKQPEPKPKKRQLFKSESSRSERQAKKKKESPKKQVVREIIREVGRGRGSSGDMKVAPTQQVSVPVSNVSRGDTSELAKKIDLLLKLTASKKKKSAQRKGVTEAKKKYREMRNKAIASIKLENKEITKRENEKIKRLPAKQRAAARKSLRVQLKARIDKLKQKLPSKVKTEGQLRNLLSSFKSMKV